MVPRSRAVRWRSCVGSPSCSRWPRSCCHRLGARPPAPGGRRVRHRSETSTLDATVRGSVGQVAVTGAKPGEPLELVDRRQRVVARGNTDAAGALLFRDVAPATGYRVVAAGGGARSASLRVLRPDEHPDESFYRAQHLGPGYQYLTTRDGTLLAVNVRLRGPSRTARTRPWSSTRATTRRTPTRTKPGMRLAATARLRDGGREHPRHRLLRRRLRVLRDRCSRSTATTRSRSSPRSPGSRTGRVGMVGISYSGHHAALRRRARARRTSPRSRRSR